METITLPRRVPRIVLLSPETLRGKKEKKKPEEQIAKGNKAEGVGFIL